MSMFLSSTAVSFVNLLHILAPLLETVHRFPQQLALSKWITVSVHRVRLLPVCRIALKKHNTRTTPHIFININEN